LTNYRTEEEIHNAIKELEAEFEISNKKESEKWKPAITDRPEWKTYSSWLHWDLNPWAWESNLGEDYKFSDFITENNGSKKMGKIKCQGLINLVDALEDDGGFMCVPGFHKHLKEYVEKTKHLDYPKLTLTKNSFSFSNVQPGDPINEQGQKITARAGTLIIWSSELPLQF